MVARAERVGADTELAQIAAAVERGFPVSEVRLWETPHCAAAYRAER